MFSLIVLSATNIFAQKGIVKTAKKPIVFAVLMDGERIEPIAEIDKGEAAQIFLLFCR